MEKIIDAAKCVQERGAYRIYIVVTHGIFNENSCRRLSESPITEVVKRIVTLMINDPLVAKFSVRLYAHTDTHKLKSQVEGLIFVFPHMAL